MDQAVLEASFLLEEEVHPSMVAREEVDEVEFPFAEDAEAFQVD